MTTKSRLQFYPMLRVAVMIAIGIIVGRATTTAVSPLLWLILTAVSIITYFFLRRFPIGQTVCLLISFFLFGAFVMTLKLDRMQTELPQKQVVYHAVLLSEPSVHGKVIQTDILITDEGSQMKVRASILRDTVSNCWERLHAGDGIVATSLLTEPRNFAGSTFDYATWLKYHGYSAETFIFYSDWRKAVVDISDIPYSDKVIIAARKLRQKLLTRYHDYGADGKSYALLAAMTLGDKSALSRDMKDDYAISGASHVLALSGLHLGIIYTILSLLTLGYRRKWLPQLAIMLAIWAYVIIVGMSPSVVRSAIMLTIVSIVTIMNRNAVTANSLSVAAIIMLLWNPLTLYDTGFEMSFAAVLAITTFMPMIYWRNKPEKAILRPVRWLWNVMAVSLAAQLGTAPLIVYYFGRFSCYFLLTNIIVVPCAILILYGAVMIVVMSWQSTIAAWLTGIITAIANFMNNAIHWIASLPGASIDGLSWSKWQVAGVYLIIAAIYLGIKQTVKISERTKKSLAADPQEDHSEQHKGKVNSL